MRRLLVELSHIPIEVVNVALAWRNSAFGTRHHDRILTPVDYLSSPVPALQSS
jgi:hypothetical protein